MSVPLASVSSMYRLRWVTDISDERFAALWKDVAAAGGAVGFAPGDDLALVDAAAVSTLARVRTGEELLCTASDGAELLGVARLIRGNGPRVAHTGQICGVMVSPAAQRGGIGAALLAAAVEKATELGLRTLGLDTRSGQGLEEFYTGQGWTERGRWPGAVDAGDGDYRDCVWFSLSLGGR